MTPSAASFVADLASKGRYHFTTAEALTGIGGSVPGVRASLRRLGQKGKVAVPCKGFYVIVPPEHRRLGCLPADQFIPQLMAHLGETYYVALLSAAELHGAAHQRPQAFQVMAGRNRPTIECGLVRVQFFSRKGLEHTPVNERNTPCGVVRVASPEATALELMGHANQCGGLDNVASVITELAEALVPERLLSTAQLCPISWAQRLGYILELTDHPDTAEPLRSFVRDRAKVFAPLVRSQGVAGVPRNSHWKLSINATVEPDL